MSSSVFLRCLCANRRSFPNGAGGILRLHPPQGLRGAHLVNQSAEFGRRFASLSPLLFRPRKQNTEGIGVLARILGWKLNVQSVGLLLEPECAIGAEQGY
jgi:hypothetical protein